MTLLKTEKARRRRTIWAVTAVILSASVIILAASSPRSNDTIKGKSMPYRKLTPGEERVIIHKGTEPPFSGKYYEYKAAGTYTCKQCGAPLYRSSDKFDSGCGWPSFDDEIPGAVKRSLDADGERTEITCARCGAHLGHVFMGEQLTPKDTRHCVNSISLDFVPAGETAALDTAYFAGGCFWGTEYLLQQAEGVVSTRVGYMGGDKPDPTYEDVSSDNTGHAEAVEVVFDSTKTSFDALARLFFEIHDPTQMNRQGPDIGDQYRSAIFYRNDSQKETAQRLIGILNERGYRIVTELAEAETFWEAEQYHQDYYRQTGKQPYCHRYQKRF